MAKTAYMKATAPVAVHPVTTPALIVVVITCVSTATTHIASEAFHTETIKSCGFLSL